MRKIYAQFTKIILIGLFVFTFILVAAALLSGEIEKRIRNAKIGSYQINLGKIDVRLFVGDIILSAIELTDTAGSGKVTIPEIRLEGFHWLPLIFQKRILLNNVWINGPEIVFHSGRANSDQNLNESKGISKDFLFDIRKFTIQNAKLLVDKNDSISQDSIFNTQFDVRLWGISSHDISKVLIYRKTYFDSINISLNNGFYILPGKLYRTNYQRIKYSSDTRKLNVDLITLKSEYSKYEIGQQAGTAIDWFDFKVRDLSLKNIRLEALLNDSAFISTEMRIGNFTGTVFKDKRLPFPEKSDTKLPMEMLNSLKMAYNIDSVVIDSADIEYAERVEQSNDAGYVSFNGLSAKIQNLSNIDTLIVGPTKMNVSARLMNKAVLKADFIFPNKKYPNPYRASGKLGQMEMAWFNPMVRQNASVIVKSGIIKQFYFDFQYTDEQSDGNLIFEYKDLEVALIDQSNYKTKKIKTFLVNNLVLHKENLQSDKSFRKGTIYFERDKKKSIFNYWWKSILSGIKSIAIL